MIRADGHFGSMIADERGRIVAELHNEQGGKTGYISGKRAWTLYQVIGDSFWYLCIFGTLAYPIGLTLKAAKKRRKRAIELAKDSRT
jgi:apolipoprotein N-acyltransferase